jgi:hypothetical protein
MPVIDHSPPARVLLCLGPCHGEFYLPLGLDEDMVCPVDRTHPVAIYQTPTIHAGTRPMAPNDREPPPREG